MPLGMGAQLLPICRQVSRDASAAWCLPSPTGDHQRRPCDRRSLEQAVLFGKPMGAAAGASATNPAVCKSASSCWSHTERECGHDSIRSRSALTRARGLVAHGRQHLCGPLGRDDGVTACTIVAVDGLCDGASVGGEKNHMRSCERMLSAAREYTEEQKRPSKSARTLGHPGVATGGGAIYFLEVPSCIASPTTSPGSILL